MHARKTIITCAVTGNIVTPEQHPGLPVTPAQIKKNIVLPVAAAARNFENWQAQYDRAVK